ncbi:hypothetical protein SLEP1_g22912 [Rubroshorea leprosula]|uniref:Reverse transcriptase Ty1/copia-type domain-containing protein n=1 Tax=Rubroshorea leprosula TaxID=152421 RepID=A0AAV5JAT4_9ROSI|nr:hypothetical protein SLEP1_g22912 [Rubroshorea leprosula]
MSSMMPFPHAPPNSIEDVLPAGNVLDNVEFSFLTSFVSHIGSNPVDLEPENEILNPPSSHPTRIKTWSDDSVECYKACLVAKGFTKEYEIDYKETFAPVARPTSVRNLITIAAAKKMEIVSDGCEKCLSKCPHDTALFIRKTDHGMAILLLYVDDMIIIGDDILDLEVTSSDDGYLVSHTKYAFDLLSKVGLIDSKTASTPLEPNVRLTSMDDSPLTDPTRYR